jgi:quinol monooxygenase YgiN
MATYLLHGKLVAKAGHREALAALLMEASKLMATAKGCKLYVVGHDHSDQNGVYITEIWESKADHDQSLSVQGVKELIMQAMPLLDGPPTKGQEIELLGGAGL